MLVVVLNISCLCNALNLKDFKGISYSHMIIYYRADKGEVEKKKSLFTWPWKANFAKLHTLHWKQINWSQEMVNGKRNNIKTLPFISLVQALRFPHGRFYMERTNILPMFFEKWHQEVHSQVDILNKLICRHVHMANSNRQT